MGIEDVFDGLSPFQGPKGNASEDILGLFDPPVLENVWWEGCGEGLEGLQSWSLEHNFSHGVQVGHVLGHFCTLTVRPNEGRCRVTGLGSEWTRLPSSRLDT